MLKSRVVLNKFNAIVFTLLIAMTFSGCEIYNRDNQSIYNPERITKKHFGTYVEPGNSPVEPEIFQGYHTALDFETFEDEQNIEVPVYTICEGPIVRNVWAQGYGGVLVQSCVIGGERVTVIYGHIDLGSVPDETELLQFGDFIGNLGDGYTVETDNERKHLHLGIHKGIEINLLGYVQDKAELENWINPWNILKFSDDLGD